MNETQNTKQLDLNFEASLTEAKEPCRLPPFLMKDGFYFIALGGAEKVGMNMYAYISDGKIIVVDAGYDFLNDDFPGMELGLADPAWLEDYRDCIEAMFITHSHEDHFGAIARSEERRVGKECL